MPASPSVQYQARPRGPDRDCRARDARRPSVPEAQGDRPSLGVENDAVHTDRGHRHSAYQHVPDSKELLAAARSVLENRQAFRIGDSDPPKVPLPDDRLAVAPVGQAECRLRGGGAGLEGAGADQQEHPDHECLSKESLETQTA